MSESEPEKRIYVGECGGVRIETKNFRVTMTPEQFLILLRRRAATAKKNVSLGRRLQISSSAGSSGYVSMREPERKGKR